MNKNTKVKLGVDKVDAMLKHMTGLSENFAVKIDQSWKDEVSAIIKAGRPAMLEGLLLFRMATCKAPPKLMSAIRKEESLANKTGMRLMESVHPSILALMEKAKNAEPLDA